MKPIRLSILAFVMLCTHFSQAQNFQYAKVYPTFGYYHQIVELNAGLDLIAVEAKDSMFQPDHADKNKKVYNQKDAFVICQDKNADYQWHTRFKSSGEVIIDRMWVTGSNEILVSVWVLSSDSLIVIGPSSSKTIVSKLPNPTYRSLQFIKLSANGNYLSDFLIAKDGYTTNQVRLAYPSYCNTHLDLHIGATHSIELPGRTDSLHGADTAFRFASLRVNLSNWNVDLVKRYPFLSKTPLHQEHQVLLARGIYTTSSSSTLNARLYFNSTSGLFQDSIDIINGNTYSFASIDDTLYIVSGSSVGTELHIDGTKYTHPAGEKIIVKYIKNGPVRIRNLKQNRAGQFYLAKDKQLFYAEVVTNAGSQDTLKFFDGKGVTITEPFVGYWGPVTNDSLLWVSSIHGSDDFSFIHNFQIEGGSQYVSVLLNDAIDWDPGPYTYVYDQFSNSNKEVIARYDCRPTAIFSYDQNAQKVDFINQSAMADSFRWFVGVSTAPITQKNPTFYYPAVGEYTVRLVAYNACGSDTFEFPVYIDKVVSVPQINKDFSEISPNPAGDIIRFSSSTNGILSLFTVSGKEILKSTFSPGVQEVDISGIAPGTYIVYAKSEDSVRTSKLIISR